MGVDFTMLFITLQFLPKLSTMPQFLRRLPLHTMLLPQLIMPQSRLDMLLMTLLSSPHTPSPMLLLMITQRPTSTLRRPLMEPQMLLDHTLLLFLMAESNMLSTHPTDMMVLLLMSPMRELLSTQRSPLTRLPQLTMPLPQHMPQLQFTMLKSSLCFINIYLPIY